MQTRHIIAFPPSLSRQVAVPTPIDPSRTVHGSFRSVDPDAYWELCRPYS